MLDNQVLNFRAGGAG